MARRTKAQIEADRQARAARLAAPVVTPDAPTVPGNRGTQVPQPGVSEEQRLKDIQAQRVELLAKLNRYRSEHQLEFFKPHAKQQEFVRAVLDPTKHTFSFTAGNRAGKTAIAMALAVSLAHGRLPWVPRPKPFSFPNPLSSSLANNQINLRFSKATVDAARKAWAQTYLEDPQPFPGAWVSAADGETETGTFPAAGGAKTPGTFEHLRARLQNPPDPGKLRFQPPVKIRIFGEKTDTLEQVQAPYLKKFIPPEWLALTKKGQSGVVDHFLFTNGSSIDLLTYQMEPSSMEGWDGHVCLFDEPPPRQVYIANVRGLVDHNGISLFSMTPLKEAWMLREVVANPDPSFFSLTASSYENPHIDRGALDSFLSKLSEDEQAARRDGQFLHLQGLVFKEFKKSIHVIPKFELDRRQYTYYVSIDNHPRTPHALVFMAVDRRDRMFVVKEIFDHGTPEQIAGWVTEFHDKVAPIHMALIDPSSKGDQNRGESTYEVVERILADAGIPLELGSKDLDSGILLMQEAFMSRNGIPSLFICSNCEGAIQEITEWVWDEHKGKDESVKTPKNKPVDCRDHRIEAIRRLVQLPATYVDFRHLQNSVNRWQPTDAEAGY